ncbi:uncharacterized protein PAC_10639 [Phialocephala subalpina]|uniref:Uncharacterized protein n=1 Tax=Phialocephala subalpina TaxID=576137 RepID=A0A1L7X6V3_9HELO|nr:uncharacterized protein PAC_10639 [Phialocephala subalpina]
MAPCATCQLDDWTDIVAGAKFVAKEFAILFSKAKKMFAGIFSFEKESPEETILKQQLQYQAYLEFQESERL